jgi:hypothetical protein
MYFASILYCKKLFAFSQRPYNQQRFNFIFYFVIEALEASCMQPKYFDDWITTIAYINNSHYIIDSITAAIKAQTSAYTVLIPHVGL